MKRRYGRKRRMLSLMLCLCMMCNILQWMEPVQVLAASKIVLKSGAAAPSSIYTGHGYSLKVSGTRVKFYTSNKKVATIGATTGKMKAVAPGNVKITAKSVKSGKAVASKTFKVLQRATSISTEQTIYYLRTKGDTSLIKAIKVPATSTDAVRFISADKTVATVGVTSGKMMCRGDGMTTVKVYAKATSATSNASKYNKVCNVTVYCGAWISDATFLEDRRSIQLDFYGEDKKIKDFTREDFTIQDADGNNYPIQSVITDQETGGATIILAKKLLKAANINITVNSTGSEYGLDISKSSKITLDASDFTWNKPENLLYDEHEKSVTVKADNTLADVTYTVLYGAKDGDGTDAIAKAPVDAGDYAVYVDVEDSEQYNAGRIRLGEFTIMKSFILKGEKEEILTANYGDFVSLMVETVLQDEKTTLHYQWFKDKIDDNNKVGEDSNTYIADKLSVGEHVYICSISDGNYTVNVIRRITVTCVHDYSQETISEQALAAEADCNGAAKYYYSCTKCGAIEKNSEHVFENGTPTEHNWVQDVCTICKECRQEGLEVLDFGACGKTVHYMYLNDGTIIVYGEGAMQNYESAEATPWDSYSGEISSIFIGDGITSIGDYAFADKNSLKEITFGKEVSVIGKHAFYNCGIEELLIPGTVKKIGEYAFSSCGSLSSLTLSEGIETIGACAFESCTELGNIIDDEDVTKDRVSLVIPSSVKTIEIYAFSSCYNLERVVIKQGVGSIGEDAFSNCINLQSVRIGNGVKAIGNRAFAKCGRLTSINIPESAGVGSDVFTECNGMVDSNGFIVINSGLYGYYGLESEITIPDGVKYIGKNALSMSQLEKIVFPDSVRNIDDYAFGYGYANVKKLILPEGLETIGNHVFDLFNYLEMIYIPQSVTSMGDNTYASEGKWTIYYQGTEEQWKMVSDKLGDGVKEVNYGHNHRYTNAVVTEPSCNKKGYTQNFCVCGKSGNITDIKQATGKHDIVAGIVCKDCGYTSSTSAEVVVKRGTFSGYADCENVHYLLTNGGLFIVYGEGDIPPYCGNIFSYAGGDDIRPDAVKKLVISEGINKICNNSFVGCDNMTDAIIPASLTEIAESAFANCTQLRNVSFAGEEQKIQIADNAFVGCEGLADDDGFTIYGGILYNYSGSDTEVTLPKSINVIGSNALDYDYYITGLHVMEGVTTIGEHALGTMHELTTVSLPKSLTSIGKSALMYCDSLSDVWYAGSEAEWKKLKISSIYNESLSKATIHYNHIHEFKETTYEADCKSYGYTILRCECGCTEGAKKKIVAPTQVHDFSIIQKDGTHRCTICGETKQHDFSENGKTCTQCGICKSLVMNGIHDYSQEIIIQAPTADKEGVKKLVCADCGQIKSKTVCAHTDNLDDNGFVNVDAADKEDYKKTKVLTIPGAKKLYVSIVCETEDIKNSYVKLWEGDHEDYTTSTNGENAKLGGEYSKKEFEVTGDSITIAAVGNIDFNQCYGYYVVVSAGEDTEPVSYQADSCMIKTDTNAESMHDKLRGDGQYQVGKSFRISAMESKEWKFDGWYQGETLITKETVYDGTVTNAMKGATQEFTARYIHAIHVAGDENRCTVCGEQLYSMTWYLYDENGDLLPEDMRGTVYYAKNQNATFTAPVVEGYNFIGWYAYDADKNNVKHYSGDELCRKRQYICDVTGDATFVAVYKPNGSATITVDGGSIYTINGKTKYSVSTVEYPIGSTLSIVCSDDKFAYWKNSEGVIVSRDQEYTFTVTGKETFIAVFNSNSVNRTIVRFESYYGQEMLMRQLTKGDTMTIPDLPVRYGYTAVGWDFDGDGIYDASKDTLEAAIERGLATWEKIVVITPIYKLKEDTYTISVTGGTGTGTYHQNDVVTVSAGTPKAGHKFSHWTDASGNILSYNSNYSFFASKDIELIAIYVSDDARIETKGTTVIVDKQCDSENGKLIFVSMSTVPDGCTIDKAGIIATKDEAIGTDSTKFVASESSVYVMADKTDRAAYRYTLSVRATSGTTWYTRAYLVYTDSEGNVHTVYGQIESLQME